MSGRPQPRPRPTIRDVARLANVSPSTVSNVLNGRPVIHPATRRRVEGAIRELGYERSVAARGLRTRGMPVIGLLIEHDSRMAIRDPVHAQLLAGLLERARQRGLGVSVLAAEPEADDASILRSRRRRCWRSSVPTITWRPTTSPSPDPSTRRWRRRSRHRRP